MTFDHAYTDFEKLLMTIVELKQLDLEILEKDIRFIENTLELCFRDLYRMEIS